MLPASGTGWSRECGERMQDKLELPGLPRRESRLSRSVEEIVLHQPEKGLPDAGSGQDNRNGPIIRGFRGVP